VTPPPAPEFSRPVDLDALRESDGGSIAVEADAEERAALARRYGASAVERLAFEGAAEPWGPGGWRVTGRARAALIQTCVVTLEPVETVVDEAVDRRFAPASRLAEAEALLPSEARDELESLAEGIDAGEIAAEAVALALDPYPRKPGAAFGGRVHGPQGAEPLTDEAARPFAKLAALRNRAAED